jgi:hypothetical protein
MMNLQIKTNKKIERNKKNTAIVLWRNSRGNKSKTLVVREVWRERTEVTQGKKMRLILNQ